MKKGEKTRELIVAEAAALFNTYGYRSSSLNDIMNASGLQKGGIFHHFKNKEEIMMAAFDYAVKTAGRAIKERVDAKRTSKQKLFALIESFSELPTSPPIPGGCPILNVAVECDDADPVLKAAAAQALSRLHRFVVEIIRTGAESGEFIDAPVPESGASFIIAALEGALMMSKLTEDQVAMHSVAAMLKHEISRWCAISTKRDQ